MKRRLLAVVMLTSNLLMCQSYALEIIGNRVVNLPATKSLTNNVKGHRSLAIQQEPLARSEPKQVGLMLLRLNAKEKSSLLGGVRKKSLPLLMGSTPLPTSSSLPSAANMGMNNVPVLDQGQHGACATFAVSAVIDALLGKGDYISQLCTLSLGSYLENRSYINSGWEGSMNSTVLQHFIDFGIVSKSNQRTLSCGGLKEYPLNLNQEPNEMSLDDFHRISQNISDKLMAYNVLNFAERLNWNEEDDKPAKKLLSDVKTILASHSARITIGTILLPGMCNGVGICGQYHGPADTWLLSDDMKAKLYSDDYNGDIAGHAMIVVGYDDNAVVTDNAGKKHTGVLILRNSWGENAGDHGNYYMTYDYFMYLTIEVNAISLLPT